MHAAASTATDALFKSPSYLSCTGWHASCSRCYHSHTASIQRDKVTIATSKIHPSQHPSTGETHQYHPPQEGTRSNEYKQYQSPQLQCINVHHHAHEHLKNQTHVSFMLQDHISNMQHTHTYISITSPTSCTLLKHTR